ncbi:TonB-dependent receptor [Janthinobacterium rivuli]|uniref:TonB-dependent receptor n=1 Tax=Janthinobacterium rivuli TaxID=2751478 RepID=UPI00383A1932
MKIYHKRIDHQPACARPRLHRCACALAAAHVLAAALPAAAQQQRSTTMPVIEVMAEKRSARLAEVPMSISAKTGEELADAETASVTELSRSVPNLHIFSWGGRRDTNIFIRGIGPGLFTEPTVGFYVDGVNYLGNGMFDLDFLDIERIEVLRGPQGVLYGGNSLGGVINVVTCKPGNASEGKVALQFDDRGAASLKAMAATPLIKDELFWSLALGGSHADGYVRSGLTGNKLNTHEDYTLRTKLRWVPNSKLELNWIVDAEHFNGGSYTYGPLDEMRRDRYTTQTVLGGVDRRESAGTSVQLKWSGDSVDLTSVTGWRDWRSVNGIHQQSSSYGFYKSNARENQTQLTQEVRLASKGPGPLAWLAGLYAYDTRAESGSLGEVDYTGAVMGGPYYDRLRYHKDGSGYALFGQASYQLTPALSVTAGLRMDDETRKIDAWSQRETMGVAYPVKEQMSFHQWLPKGSVSYAPAPGALWYASVARGYRAGGYDTIYLDRDKPSFQSEQSTSYEAGYKGTFWERRADFSVAVFRIDLSNQQVQRVIPSARAFNIVTDNAGKGRSTGAEAELRMSPAPGWLVGVGAGYTRTEFIEYQYDQSTDYAGRHFPFAPTFSGNLSLQNRRPLGGNLSLFTRADLQYTGKHYFDAANTLKQDGYALLNLKMGVEAEKWDAYLWVKNAGNKFYSSAITQQGVTPLAEVGPPRLVGATLTLRF